MRDINRIPKILERLSVVWKKYPDLRLVQLIDNVITNSMAYYIEDEELLEKIEAFYGGIDE